MAGAGLVALVAFAAWRAGPGPSALVRAGIEPPGRGEDAGVPKGARSGRVALAAQRPPSDRRPGPGGLLHSAVETRAPSLGERVPVAASRSTVGTTATEESPPIAESTPSVDRAARPSRAPPHPPLAPAELARLVEDLRDDDVRFNAVRSISVLRGAGPEVLGPLQEALASPDWQQRQLAAYVLALREDVFPTPALATVLIEGMRDDGLPYGPTRPTWQGPGDHAYSYVTNNRVALRALRRDPLLFQLAEAGLVAALESTDGQQQVGAAFALACARSHLDLPRTCDVLIEHLRDNRLPGDAVQGMIGLSSYGAAAYPHVQAALPGQDEQQRALLAHWLGHFAPAHPAANKLSPKELSAAGMWRRDPCLARAR